MQRLALAILVVALGAVRAEAQEPQTLAKLSVPAQQAVLGHSIGTKISLGECMEGQVFLFFGSLGGTSTVSVGGTQVNVPLGGNAQLVGSGVLSDRSWKGYATLPTTSALVGQLGGITAVIVHNKCVQVVTLAVSIGPIIEDGLM